MKGKAWETGGDRREGEGEGQDRPMSVVAQSESRDQSGRERSTGGGSGLFGRGWWDMMAKVFSIQRSAFSKKTRAGLG